MSDLFEQVTADQDPLKKIVSLIPGFGGYIERQNRRAADKLLRETIGAKFREQWKRVGDAQQELTAAGEITSLDDMEKAAMKIQTFIDKIENASYGQSSFFDSVKINEEELAKIYEFDASLLDMAAGIASALDNILASIGTDGLPAAVNHLVTLSRDLVTAFEGRDQVIMAAK